MEDFRVQTRRAVGGRLWVIDEREQAGIGRRTTPYWGWESDVPERRVWVQLLIHGEDWDDDREHLRRAYELAQRSEISGCPHILQVLDLIDDFNTYLVSEAAQTTLDVVLRDGPLERGELYELETALQGALDVLHGEGLVHCDVREDNIFRVGDRWKLGDLGGAVEVGAPIVALPKDREYVPEGVQLGCAAKAEFDLYALGVVLDHARSGRAPTR